MNLLLFTMSQAFATSPNIAVLDVACAEEAPVCQAIMTAVQYQVQRQLAGIDINHRLANGHLSPSIHRTARI